MADEKAKIEVDISEAKGRPMLQWSGKAPLRRVTTYPAQLMETFNPQGTDLTAQNALYYGDNKDALAYLLSHGYREQVKLVYIDPPFDSGADYVRKVALRGATRKKLNGESYGLGEQVQYADIWENDSYLQFLYERLVLLKELIAASGFIAVQCDSRKVHHIRCLLDEVFTSENFRGEILVRAGTKNVQSQFEQISSLSQGHNSLLLYSKSFDTKIDKLLDRQETFEAGKWDTFWRGTDRPTMRYELLGITPLDGQWRWEPERAKKAVDNYADFIANYASNVTLDEYYIAQLEETGAELDFVRKDESGTIQYYVSPRDYKILSNVWFDLAYRGTRTNYPTEKNEEPLDRLINWLTTVGDLVLDCFIGSGTTAAVAQRLGRRWIGCDINKGAIQTASKRLQNVILQQIAQPELFADNTKSKSVIAFSTYRINDYDLQIQHNEALNLIVDFIGVTRTPTDSFFDGTRGKHLVKVIPLNRPFTPLDLQMIRDELRTRSEEDRDITVVCLGKEIAAEQALDEYNRNRPVNKIHLIELRTDAKYGQFLVHETANGEVRIWRDGDKIRVKVDDFLSPTIIKRLNMEDKVFRAEITDWRSMVDVILIDSAYNGDVFNITYSDVPKRKDDLVQGEYELRAPDGETMVAVKIIDMLGEELLITQKV